MMSYQKGATVVYIANLSTSDWPPWVRVSTEHNICLQFFRNVIGTIHKIALDSCKMAILRLITLDDVKCTHKRLQLYVHRKLLKFVLHFKVPR